MLPGARRIAKPRRGAAVPERLEGSLALGAERTAAEVKGAGKRQQGTSKNLLIVALEQRQLHGNGRICSRSNCRALGRVVTLRPRICYVLSLLRIHNPNCKHCAAHLTCGNELRKRLEELNELLLPVQFPGVPGGVEIALAIMPPERTETRKAA